MFTRMVSDEVFNQARATFTDRGSQRKLNSRGQEVLEHGIASSCGGQRPANKTEVLVAECLIFRDVSFRVGLTTSKDLYTTEAGALNTTREPSSLIMPHEDGHLEPSVRSYFLSRVCRCGQTRGLCLKTCSWAAASHQPRLRCVLRDSLMLLTQRRHCSLTRSDGC